MKRVLVSWLFLVLSASCFAQLDSQAVPDLSAFAGAIAASASAAPVPGPSTQRLFESGLPVPSVTPGAAAKRIGAQLRAGLEAKTGPNPAFAQLESGMPGVLSSVEDQLEKEGFRKRDLGVAMAYTFLMTYETATQTKVPDEPGRVAARAVARAIGSNWGPVFTKLPDAKKEDMYESLIVSTTLVSAFSAQFTKAGKTAEADTMRQLAGQMFEKLLGVPPAQVTIAADGRISGLAAAGAARAPAEASPKNAVPSQTASLTAAPAHAARDRKPGGGKEIKGVWRADWVENVFGVGGLQLLAQNVTFSFDGDGDFIAHLPAGKSLSPEDLRDLVAAAPNTGGKYEIAGDELRLRYGSGTEETFHLARSSGTISGLRGRGRVFSRKIVPPDGTRLSRTYGSERITSVGTNFGGEGTFVSGSSRISFTPDGRYRSGSSVALTSQQVSGLSKNPAENGHYEIRDGALRMEGDDGKRTTYFIWTEQPDLSTIFLNNALYE